MESKWNVGDNVILHFTDEHLKDRRATVTKVILKYSKPIILAVTSDRLPSFGVAFNENGTDVEHEPFFNVEKIEED